VVGRKLSVERQVNQGGKTGAKTSQVLEGCIVRKKNVVEASGIPKLLDMYAKAGHEERISELCKQNLPPTEGHVSVGQPVTQRKGEKPGGGNQEKDAIQVRGTLPDQSAHGFENTENTFWW